MIEHYSKKIQNTIQKELFKANKSVKIAVAWFTNDLLFQPLLLKLAAGVTVEIILNKDEINCSDENEIDFDEFVNAGGILRWNDTKQLLHDKFCIIDDKIVIYGSYNWTNKAEYNEESIAIARDEENTINFYLDKFSDLSRKYPKEKVTKKASTFVVRDNRDDTVIKNTTSVGKSSIEEDLYYTDSYGAIYSKDFRILYKGVDIKEFKIDERTREIKENAFLGFNNLEKIELRSLERIGDNAFKDCKSLKQVDVFCLDHCEFGKNVFKNCISLDGITSNRSLYRDWTEAVTSGMFMGCLSLESFNFKNIKAIGDSAFEGCVNLKTINNLSNAKSIGERAFYGCHSLKEIILPKELKDLGKDSLADCVKLVQIKVGYLSFLYKNEEKKYYSFKRIIGDNTPLTKLITSEVSIPSNAFEGCTTLREVVLQTEFSLTGIGNYAFSGCTQLERIEFACEVFDTSIGDYAFHNCTFLKNLPIMERFTYIGKWAFKECTSIREILIPKSVEVIEEGAFHGCNNVITIKVDPSNKIYDSRNDCNALIKTDTNEIIKGCNWSKIDKSITKIGNHAFDGCSLVIFDIPNSVKTIDEYAFANCSVTTLTLPQLMKTIPKGCFMHSRLLKIYIPNSVETIEENAFHGCIMVFSGIELPPSIKIIPKGCFSHSHIKQILLPDSIEVIEDEAFYCSSIRQLNFPPKLRKIGSRAFWGCLSPKLSPPQIQDIAPDAFPIMIIK